MSALTCLGPFLNDSNTRMRVGSDSTFNFSAHADACLRLWFDDLGFIRISQSELI